MAVGIALGIIIVVLLIVGAQGLRIVQEYERGVIFRLGRCVGAKGPGLFFIIPGLDKMRKVNLQTQAVPVASQQVITKDNVTVAVDAVAYFRVKDPVASVLKIQNWFNAAQLVAQTSLRSIIGRHELDQLLGERDRINTELKTALDEQTEAWGVQVDLVEIRDVGLPEQMQRAMARQAEAERERRAKVIAADGEFQAAEKLGEAAEAMTDNPGAMQLRTLQTMAEIATERNSTIIFPIPVEIISILARPGRAVRAGRHDRVLRFVHASNCERRPRWGRSGSGPTRSRRCAPRRARSIEAGRASMMLDAKPGPDLPVAEQIAVAARGDGRRDLRAPRHRGAHARRRAVPHPARRRAASGVPALPRRRHGRGLGRDDGHPESRVREAARGHGRVGRVPQGAGVPVAGRPRRRRGGGACGSSSTRVPSSAPSGC